MNREELLKKVSEILGEIVDDENLQLTEEMIADDVADWDSTNRDRVDFRHPLRNERNRFAGKCRRPYRSNRKQAKGLTRRAGLRNSRDRSGLHRRDHAGNRQLALQRLFDRCAGRGKGVTVEDGESRF